MPAKRTATSNIAALGLWLVVLPLNFFALYGAWQLVEAFILPLVVQ